MWGVHAENPKQWEKKHIHAKCETDCLKTIYNIGYQSNAFISHPENRHPSSDWYRIMCIYYPPYWYELITSTSKAIETIPEDSWNPHAQEIVRMLKWWHQLKVRIETIDCLIYALPTTQIQHLMKLPRTSLQLYTVEYRMGFTIAWTDKHRKKHRWFHYKYTWLSHIYERSE